MNSANNLLWVGSNRKFLVEELVYCAKCGTNHAEDDTVFVVRLFMSQKAKGYVRHARYKGEYIISIQRFSFYEIKGELLLHVKILIRKSLVLKIS